MQDSWGIADKPAKHPELRAGAPSGGGGVRRFRQRASGRKLEGRGGGAGRCRAALRPAGWSVRALRPRRATCPAFFWLFRARAEPRRRGSGCRSRTCGSGASQVSGFRRTFAHTGRLVGTLLARAPVPGARNGPAAPRVDLPVGFKPRDSRAFPSRPCGGAGRRGSPPGAGWPLPRLRCARGRRTREKWNSPTAAPATRRAGPGEGELVEAPVPEVSRSGDRPGAQGCGFQVCVPVGLEA